MEFQTYLDQLERAAKRYGVDLIEACRAEGIARTTLARWRAGTIAPRDATASAVFDRILQISAANHRRIKRLGRRATA